MIVGRLIAFKGEVDYVKQTEVLVEVTEVEGSHVEMAFDGPGKCVRTYLSVDLAQLVAEAMKPSE